jgi:hypothetical protein
MFFSNEFKFLFAPMFRLLMMHSLARWKWIYDQSISNPCADHESITGLQFRLTSSYAHGPLIIALRYVRQDLLALHMDARGVLPVPTGLTQVNSQPRVVVVVIWLVSTARWLIHSFQIQHLSASLEVFTILLFEELVFSRLVDLILGHRRSHTSCRGVSI